MLLTNGAQQDLGADDLFLESPPEPVSPEAATIRPPRAPALRMIGTNEGVCPRSQSRSAKPLRRAPPLSKATLETSLHGLDPATHKMCKAFFLKCRPPTSQQYDFISSLLMVDKATLQSFFKTWKKEEDNQKKADKVGALVLSGLPNVADSPFSDISLSDDSADETNQS